MLGDTQAPPRPAPVFINVDSAVAASFPRASQVTVDGAYRRASQYKTFTRSPSMCVVTVTPPVSVSENLFEHHWKSLFGSVQGPPSAAECSRIHFRKRFRVEDDGDDHVEEKGTVTSSGGNAPPPPVCSASPVEPPRNDEEVQAVQDNDGAVGVSRGNGEHLVITAAASLRSLARTLLIMRCSRKSEPVQLVEFRPGHRIEFTISDVFGSVSSKARYIISSSESDSVECTFLSISSSVGDENGDITNELRPVRWDAFLQQSLSSVESVSPQELPAALTLRFSMQYLGYLTVLQRCEYMLRMLKRAAPAGTSLLATCEYHRLQGAPASGLSVNLHLRMHGAKHAQLNIEGLVMKQEPEQIIWNWESEGSSVEGKGLSALLSMMV